MYRRQVARGAYFLDEHLAGATSLVEPCVMAVLSLSGVRRVRADQCMHGQESDAGNPIRKPTGFMSNSVHLLDALNKRCFGRKGLCSRPGGGVHQPCLGKVARRAAIFSDVMCEIIFSGFSAQMKADRRMRENEHGLNHVMLEGSDGVNDYFTSVAGEPADLKSRPLEFAASQRGTMPGEVIGGQEASEVISALQRGTMPGRIIGEPLEARDPFVDVVNRHERFIGDITGQPLNPELCESHVGRRLITSGVHACGT